MVWISKQRLNVIQNKLKELDPENVSQNLTTSLNELDKFMTETAKGLTEKLNEAIKELEKTKQTIRQELEKAVDEKTKGLTNRLMSEIKAATGEQDKKIEEFISLSKKNTIRALAGSFELVRKTLGITEPEWEKVVKEEKKAIKEGAKG